MQMKHKINETRRSKKRIKEEAFELDRGIEREREREREREKEEEEKVNALPPP